MGKKAAQAIVIILLTVCGCAALSSKVATTKARTITTGDIDISGSTFIAAIQTVAISATVAAGAYWTIWHRRKFHGKGNNGSQAQIEESRSVHYGSDPSSKHAGFQPPQAQPRTP